MFNRIYSSLSLVLAIAVASSAQAQETIRGTWAPAFPPSQEAANYEKNGVTFGILFFDDKALPVFIPNSWDMNYQCPKGTQVWEDAYWNLKPIRSMEGVERPFLAEGRKCPK
jgi:hypothetical protein